MKCLTTVSVTEVGLEAEFSTRDILQAMLAHTHKVQQVKSQQGQEHSLAGMRNTSHLALTFTGSSRVTGSDRRSSRNFWAGENLGVEWRTLNKARSLNKRKRLKPYTY